MIYITGKYTIWAVLIINGLDCTSVRPFIFQRKLKCCIFQKYFHDGLMFILGWRILKILTTGCDLQKTSDCLMCLKAAGWFKKWKTAYSHLPLLITAQRVNPFTLSTVKSSDTSSSLQVTLNFIICAFSSAVSFKSKMWMKTLLAHF